MQREHDRDLGGEGGERLDDPRQPLVVVDVGRPVQGDEDVLAAARRRSARHAVRSAARRSPRRSASTAVLPTRCTRPAPTPSARRLSTACCVGANSVSAIVSSRTRLTSSGTLQSCSRSPASTRATGRPSLVAASAHPSAEFEAPATSDGGGLQLGERLLGAAQRARRLRAVGAARGVRAGGRARAGRGRRTSPTSSPRPCADPCAGPPAGTRRAAAAPRTPARASTTSGRVATTCTSAGAAGAAATGARGSGRTVDEDQPRPRRSPSASRDRGRIGGHEPTLTPAAGPSPERCPDRRSRSAPSLRRVGARRAERRLAAPSSASAADGASTITRTSGSVPLGRSSTRPRPARRGGLALDRLLHARRAARRRRGRARAR